MKKAHFVATLLLIAALSLPSKATIITAGIEDDFTLPTEAAAPSNHLASLLISTGGRLRDFDAMGTGGLLIRRQKP